MDYKLTPYWFRQVKSSGARQSKILTEAVAGSTVGKISRRFRYYGIHNQVTRIKEINPKNNICNYFIDTQLLLTWSIGFFLRFTLIGHVQISHCFDLACRIQRMIHDSCTHFEVPAQWQGLMRSWPSLSWQIRHSRSSVRLCLPAWPVEDDSDSWERHTL